jgi:hypothetical protein
VLLTMGLLAGMAARSWFGKSRPPIVTVSNAITTIAWSEDFESGSALGWTGRIVDTDLPRGSQFGFAAVPMHYPDGVYYGIKLPDQWQKGLFTLEAGSTLHITYKLGSRLGVNVFMHTMHPNTATKVDMFELRPSRFPGKSGQWQTASIPFSKFVRKVRLADGRWQFAGGPPTPGEIVATLVFSTPEELDLIIDKIWVTSTGTTDEEVFAGGDKTVSYE